MSLPMMKYSDLLAEWLVELGYTHCFFLAGGNIMHLLESCSRRLTCIPVVHEVTAGIAAEYFNEMHLPPAGGIGQAKAFALVTAGPGMTNLMTALAGAWLESRELLVLGGQVKGTDLAQGGVRQRGIQEVDGVALAGPVTERAERLTAAVDQAGFAALTRCGAQGRKGPVFLEIPLDVQGAQVEAETLRTGVAAFVPGFEEVSEGTLAGLGKSLREAQRPVLLVGAGVDRETAQRVLESPAWRSIGIPIMTTWNAADRLGAEHPRYFGRPNTWGMRYSNVLLQQADLLVALGTRLGLQQTGFNWQAFLPVGRVIQVDCDAAELAKGHPTVSVGVCGDANLVLQALAAADLGAHTEWLAFCAEVKAALPVVEAVNRTGAGFLNPYAFVAALSTLCTPEDLIVPCSSGSAFTVTLQTFAQKAGQRVVTNKSLASMGYGLAGAIGAAFAGRGQSKPRRTILVEGDGGFAQNLQDLGTVRAHQLPIKMFLFDDNGYASIRMTQKNYFGGRYVGCDAATGLGLPDWELLFAAYSVPVMRIGPGFAQDENFLRAFDSAGPQAFLVQVDPDQTYLPKISSRVTASGSMESNPLERMTPDLDPAVSARVFRYLPD